MGKGTQKPQTNTLNPYHSETKRERERERESNSGRTLEDNRHCHDDEEVSSTPSPYGAVLVKGVENGEIKPNNSNNIQEKG